MFCEHFGRCGGCAYLDITYEEELALKKASLAETLGEYAGFLDVLHPAPSPEGYRNKMELAFGDEGKDGQLALGMRKKRSYYEVATPTDCVLINDDFKKIIQYVLEFFRSSGETFFHRKRHTGALRHLVLRRGEFTGEILILFSTTSTLKLTLVSVLDGLLALPLDGKIVGIMHSVNDGVADAVKNENLKILHGRDYYNEEICGLKFKVSMFSFFQTNSKGAEVLYDIVKKFAGSSTPPRQKNLALDLYCGTGTIAQIVSPDFDNVIGVEIIEEAIQAARENALLNNIENCEFHAADALVFLENLPPHLSTIIVDPPRDGLHPKALLKIAASAVPYIVYVACKPKSLARDLPVFIEAGYVVERIEGVDMFPRTPHVEAVALLRWGDT